MEPRGFRALGKHIGIKDQAPDFALIVSDVPATAAAMFTQSKFCGPSVVVGREHVASGKLQAIVVTSGIANVATGAQGLSDAREIARAVAEVLNIDEKLVLPSSTGVIGWSLPMDKVRKAIASAPRELAAGRLVDAATAIITTDPRPKFRSVNVAGATIFGMIKGAGMIEPDMATMLSYFVTDAALSSEVLQPMFKRVINRSLNMMTVDSDTSTSDTAVILANGLAGAVDEKAFEQALQSLAIDLAKDVMRDSEGASKLIEVQVEQARSFSEAKRIAKIIANSPLVKTAVYGCDPNWGRVAMALGKTYSDDVDPESLTIAFGPTAVYRAGVAADLATLEQVRTYLQQSEVVIRVALGKGTENATVWGCDLTERYIEINASYTS